MSVAAAQAFRRRLNLEPSLREPFLHAYEQSAEAVIARGHAHGFDFTEAELDEELSSIAPDRRTPFEQQVAQDVERRMRGELNDHELELVSAGGTPACNPAQSQSGAAKA